MKHYLRAKFKATVDVKFEFDTANGENYARALRDVDGVRRQLSALGVIDKESVKIETAKE